MQLVLKLGDFFPELVKGLATRVFSGSAAAPAPALPVLAPKPPHACAQGRDLVFGMHEGRDRPLGAAGVALLGEPTAGEVCQTLLENRDPAVERTPGHHLLVLAERPLHQLVGFLGPVITQQVQRHVVCRSELAFDRHLLAGGGLVDGADVDVRFLEDDAVSDRVDSAAPSSAHQLGELARGQRLEVLPVEFGERGDHHCLSRHVDAQ